MSIQSLLKNFGLILLLWNCRSIVSNLTEFKNYVFKNQPHLICLTETWLNPSDKFILKGYNVFRKDRLGRGGGVAILVKNNFHSFLNVLTHTFQEILNLFQLSLKLIIFGVLF